MTKITTYNRGIIIDGHADTKEECETITLLCDSLAKDKNFKQVAYDKGYAAFERVGKADRLRFVILPQNGLTVNFDTGIQSVGFSYGSNTHTFTTSEELYEFAEEPGSDITLTVNLKSGYTLKSSSLGSISGNIVTIPFSNPPTPTSITCTLVSEAATVKKFVDLTTLSGWANLAPGNHTIKIVAKGTGYRDSEPSAGVTVTKPAAAYTDCLTFTGETSEFTLKPQYQPVWDGTLYYSTDHNTWTVWYGDEINSANKKLYLKGKGNTKFEYYDDNTEDLYYAEFRLSSKASCSGNIQTLLDWENPPTSIPSDDCFNRMFFGCTNLTTAPELPATTLAAHCYDSMFGNCTNLTTAPDLPATTLAGSCYSQMFLGCTSLTSAPELPATILAEYCYSSMFNGCTNLTTAPVLPATTLVKYCYGYMFQGCTKLKVNSSSGNKIFTCPSTIPSMAVTNMFTNTGGTFTSTPTAGNTYYWTE